MIAHAFAVQFPDSTASIAWGECPMPGTKSYHAIKHSMLVWHFTFHNVPDLPELLVAGKEKTYLKHFYDRLAQNPSAIGPADLDVYATAYAMPGAMRAALNCYRTFETDGVMNQQWVKEKGKCEVDCLGLWGGKSFADEKEIREMCEEYYDTVAYETVGGAGHWIAEEKPAEFVEKVIEWFEKM